MGVAMLRNPYDYANPARPEVFSGRGAELGHLAYVLDQAAPDRAAGFVAVHGERASGKTSLLNMGEVLARERGLLPVRVDLVPGDEEPHAFFAKLHEEVVGALPAAALPPQVTRRTIRRLRTGTDRDDAYPLEFPETLAQPGPLSEAALRADLRQLAAWAGRPIVIFVDEAQIVGRSETALSVLRTLGTHITGYVFVLAGTPDMIAHVKTVFDRLLRQFSYIGLTRFTGIDAVRECMSRPLESIGLAPDRCFDDVRALAEDLLNATDGNPYELQFFCHAMFARWQAGEATEMRLTADVFDDVHQRMEIVGGPHEGPLAAAVREFSVADLEALNVLCSSLDEGTLDEVWFAHQLAGRPAMSRAEFDARTASFAERGLVTIDRTVSLAGGLADHVYARVWTLKQYGDDRPYPVHRQMIGRSKPPYLFARNLEYLLCETVTDQPAELLRTCCFGMDPAHVDTAVLQLEGPAPDAEPAHAVDFLYRSILRLGVPAALDVTTVRVGFHGVTATRWLVSADADDFDLTALDPWRRIRATIEELGGTLTAERTRLPLTAWPEIVGWQLRKAGPQSRPMLAGWHADAGFADYGRGGYESAYNSLVTAFRYHPHWLAANNLAYIALRMGSFPDAARWAEQARELATAPAELALSAYNQAMALLRTRDLAGARAALAAAPTDTHDAVFAYLLIPRIAGEAIDLVEETDVPLDRAVTAAIEFIDIAERYAALTET